MSTKNELSRITIDLPKEDHKKLKALAAITDKSMRDVVVELINDYINNVSAADKRVLKAMQNIGHDKED